MGLFEQKEATFYLLFAQSSWGKRLISGLADTKCCPGTTGHLQNVWMWPELRPCRQHELLTRTVALSSAALPGRQRLSGHSGSRDVTIPQTSCSSNNTVKIQSVTSCTAARQERGEAPRTRLLLPGMRLAVQCLRLLSQLLSSSVLGMPGARLCCWRWQCCPNQRQPVKGQLRSILTASEIQTHQSVCFFSADIFNIPSFASGFSFFLPVIQLLLSS